MPGNPLKIRTAQRRTLKRSRSRCRERSRREGSWMTTASRSTWTTFSLRTTNLRPNYQNYSRWLTPGSSRGRKRNRRRGPRYMPPERLHRTPERDTCTYEQSTTTRYEVQRCPCLRIEQIFRSPPPTRELRIYVINLRSTTPTLEEVGWVLYRIFARKRLHTTWDHKNPLYGALQLHATIDGV